MTLVLYPRIIFKSFLNLNMASENPELLAYSQTNAVFIQLSTTSDFSPIVEDFRHT